MSNYPQDVAQEALDAAGIDFILGDVEEGTKPAQILLRKYGQCMRSLLRAAHWDWARAMRPLTLLADASGQTTDVGTSVVAPWLYEYSLPLDCVFVRFVPWNALAPTPAIPATNTQVSNVPQTGGQQTVYAPGMRLIPAPFLVTTDTNYTGDFSNPAWVDFPGISPAGRIVICTNVQQASLVYTAFIPYPNMWTPDFRQAFVAYLASEIALPLAKDKKFGMQLRDANIKIAVKKVIEARVTSANEGSFPQSTDIIPDYIQIRASGAGAGAGPWGPGLGFSGTWGGPGSLGCGWGGLACANGSVY